VAEFWNPTGPPAGEQVITMNGMDKADARAQLNAPADRVDAGHPLADAEPPDMGRSSVMASKLDSRPDRR